MRTPLRPAACAAAAILATAIAGCGGRDDPPAPPRVVGLASVQLDQDTVSPPIAFRILDADTPPERLVVTLVSSNEALLPRAAIALDGSGEARTLILTPTAEATGEATVTVQVRDDDGLTTAAALRVVVAPVLRSFRALTNDTFAVGESGAPSTLRGFTLQPDADDDPSAFEALLR